ncbi:MAG: hypothetical protein AAF399_20300 [Bacteroidota bacterium]
MSWSQPSSTNQHMPGQSSSSPSTPMSSWNLFPVAVFIMGVVSAYTTALGLYPMLQSWILSYAMAIALSLFLIAIALRIGKAANARQRVQLLLGYTLVASFSVLLNFNAIYGSFSAEKLLYEELKTKRAELSALQVEANQALKDHFQATETEQQLKEAQALLEEERTNPNNAGYGKVARRLNQETVIPLTARLATIKDEYEPAKASVDSVILTATGLIDDALASESLLAYRQAVDHSVDAYAEVGRSIQQLVGKEGLAFAPSQFQHRDVGNLNHSLWTVFHLGQFNSKEISAVLVSLLLAFLIDFIVLFVLMLVDTPTTSEESEAVPQTESNDQEQLELPSSIPQPQPTTRGLYASREYRSSNPSTAAYRPPVVTSKTRKDGPENPLLAWQMARLNTHSQVYPSGNRPSQQPPADA